MHQKEGKLAYLSEAPRVLWTSWVSVIRKRKREVKDKFTWSWRSLMIKWIFPRIAGKQSCSAFGKWWVQEFLKCPHPSPGHGLDITKEFCLLCSRLKQQAVFIATFQTVLISIISLDSSNNTYFPVIQVGSCQKLWHWNMNSEVFIASPVSFWPYIS